MGSIGFKRHNYFLFVFLVLILFGCSSKEVDFLEKPDLNVKVENLFSSYRVQIMKLSTTKRFNMVYTLSNITSLISPYSPGNRVFYLYSQDKVPFTGAGFRVGPFWWGGGEYFVGNQYENLSVPISLYQLFLPTHYPGKEYFTGVFGGYIGDDSEYPKEIYVFLDFIKHGKYLLRINEGLKCRVTVMTLCGKMCPVTTERYCPYPVTLEVNFKDFSNPITLDASSFYKKLIYEYFWSLFDLHSFINPGVSDIYYNLQSECEGALLASDLSVSENVSYFPVDFSFKFPGSGSNGKFSEKEKFPFVTMGSIIDASGKYLYTFYFYNFDSLPDFSFFPINDFYSSALTQSPPIPGAGYIEKIYYIPEGYNFIEAYNFIEENFYKLKYFTYWRGFPVVAHLTGGHNIFIGNFAKRQYFNGICPDACYQNAVTYSSLLEGCDEVLTTDKYLLCTSDSTVRYFKLGEYESSFKLGVHEDEISKFYGFSLTFSHEVTLTGEKVLAIAAGGGVLLDVEERKDGNCLVVRSPDEFKKKYEGEVSGDIGGTPLLKFEGGKFYLLYKNHIDVISVDGGRIRILYSRELTEFTLIGRKWFEVSDNRLFVSEFEEEELYEIFKKYEDAVIYSYSSSTTVGDFLQKYRNFKLFRLKFCEYRINSEGIEKIGCLPQVDTFYYPEKYKIGDCVFTNRQWLGERINAYVNAGEINYYPLFSLLDAHHVIFPGLAYFKIPDEWLDIIVKVEGGLPYLRGGRGFPGFELYSTPLVFYVK